MNIKALVNLALEGRTPDEKVALMCQVTGKDPARYAHLDNGRKSMTAGNVLRGECQGAIMQAKLIAAAGLQDLDLDSLPAAEPVTVRKATPHKAHKITPAEADENYEPVKHNTSCTIHVSPDAYFSAYVLSPAYREGCK